MLYNNIKIIALFPKEWGRLNEPRVILVVNQKDPPFASTECYMFLQTHSTHVILTPSLEVILGLPRLLLKSPISQVLNYTPSLQSYSASFGRHHTAKPT